MQFVCPVGHKHYYSMWGGGCEEVLNLHLWHRNPIKAQPASVYPIRVAR